MLAYIQPIQIHPAAAGGVVRLYLAGTTEQVPVLDPVTGAPSYMDVPINSAGIASGYHVESGILYDMKVFTSAGALYLTRENVSVVGDSAGVPGPQGPRGFPGDKGDTGPAGTNGTNGTDGTNGADGANGADGISLLSIRVDESSPYRTVYYRLSSNPGQDLPAGNIAPNGWGLASVSETDTPGYLEEKQVGTDGQILIASSGSQLTFSLDPALISRLDTLETSVEDHGARITAIESVSPARQVLFGGTLGATSVVIPHSLGTSNVAVSCYDGVTGALIFLNVVVTDTQVGISDLAPMVANNQIKVVLVR